MQHFHKSKKFRKFRKFSELLRNRPLPAGRTATQVVGRPEFLDFPRKLSINFHPSIFFGQPTISLAWGSIFVRRVESASQQPESMQNYLPR